MATVNFQNVLGNRVVLYFDDLDLNDSFRVNSKRSRGAVYRKVLVKDAHDYMMLEEATGKIFDPTSSPVEPVKVTVTIDAVKPSIY